MNAKIMLIVPPEGDPLKLLGDPKSAAWRYGARPPLMYLHPEKGWLLWVDGYTPKAVGLMVGVEGEALEIGCFLYQEAHGMESHLWTTFIEMIEETLAYPFDNDCDWSAGEHVVVLDSKNREITPDGS